MKRWVQGQVVENKQQTERLYSLLIDASVQPFQAGQFTTLALDIDGERVARPYSYVNAPDKTPLEFYFNTVPEGILSNKMCQLAPGDSIWVAAQPVGFFTLAEVPDSKHLWLFASGTAIGPFLSILKTAEPWQRFSKIILVHAVRYAKELSHQSSIHSCQEAHPEKFVMVPFVSREETDFAIKGRIPQAIESSELERKVGLTLDSSQSQVMICGNPGMVWNTQQVLNSRGLRKNLRRKPGNVTVESYSYNK